MGNKEVGELVFEAGGKSYTLRFGAWAIAELEAALDRSMMSIAREVENPEELRAHTMIAAIWAGLQQHHPDIDRRQAAMIMDKIGFAESGDLLGKAFELAFPDQEGDASGENPPAGNRRDRRAAAAKERKG